MPCLSINAQEQKKSNFARQTIDMGVVVTDIEKSLDFYKKVVGFSEAEGFKVAGKFPKSVGLTDGTPLSIHVLTLGTEEHATKLKLMQVAAKARPGYQTTLHPHHCRSVLFDHLRS